MKNTTLALALSLLTIALSCKKTNDNPGTNTNDKIAPDGFTFKTTKDVSIDIKLLAPDNTPLKNVIVELYNNIELQENGNAATGTALFTALSDNNGQVKATVSMPASTDTLLVNTRYTGMVHYVKGYLSGTSFSAVIGGADGLSGNVVTALMQRRKPAGNTPSTSFAPNTNYSYMGLADLQGRPVYLTTADVISSTLLSYINASLPEGTPLTTTHPQYLTDDATSDINVTVKSDVFITFVSEGAGNTNSLGWYTYATGNPPASLADIATINVALPNASAYGSGGNMRAGDKVKLGNFSPGTSIGFVLFSNAWIATNLINTAAAKYYSTSALNPESGSLKKHTVLLYDATNKYYIIGFEDLARNSSGCDNDFNDLVFYASANPTTGISTGGVAPIDKPGDSDNDGVSDVFDQYPNDATRAYDNYYPSASSFATLAFEDLWPSTGDYDMNDLVVNCRYKMVSNASNNIVELYGDYAVQAAGASFQNGFGVQFPFAPGLVKTVTGQKLKMAYISTAANGVEAGQAKAVIIPFDNYQNIINNYAGAFFINTKNELPKVSGDTAHVYMQFTSPITSATLGTPPFNPFAISNLKREIEIHLPGNAPTDKANAKLLGTGDDVSNAATGIYYVSKNNWPWAISFGASFTNPLEGVNISNAYTHFLDWAKSGGTSYTDWYSNTATDYRNTSNLYTK